jgi:mono/diheme cytochrome c family protein
MKLFFIILYLSVLLTACAGAPTPIPDAESRGALIYAQKCSTCHSLPHPKRHRYAEWVTMVKLMEAHMQKDNTAPLTDQERSLILNYLKEQAR